MILKVDKLKKYFYNEPIFSFREPKPVKAVDIVSFIMEKGETLGLVGESGCGKTTLAKLILKLITPSSGMIYFSDEILNVRQDVQIVFQDPYLSLNPKMRIGNILSEPFIVHHRKKEADLDYLLNMVGLNFNVIRRYPGELSGGQRQRVCIARALALKPKLLILDEPLSSLDMIIQKQILDLLLSLKTNLGLSYFFITHNISLVKKITDRVIVMKEGRIIEEGRTLKVFSNPVSGYTKKLLEASY